MRCFFRRRTCVWGRDIEMLTLRVPDPVGRGFLRSGPESNPRPRELVVRPVRGEEHRALDAVRRTDGHWLRPWEATLPPDTLEHIPTFSQYMRRADRDHREGTGLIFGVQIDGRFVGQFSISNVHWGAMSTGMLGYWIVSEWSGRGLGSLVAALVLDLVVGELGLHRVEVCVRPENERSLGVCRGLGLVEEGLRPRYMHICGQWADHIAFFIDAETLPDFEELNTMAFEACTPAFEEYVGTPYEESSLDATWYFPNATNWDAGEHVIACVAVPLEAPSLTQSVKDSNL